MNTIVEEAQSSPRSHELYIAYDVWQLLGYISRATGETREQSAEAVLREWAKANHPDVLEHIQKRSKEDDSFRKQLKDRLMGKDTMA